MFSHPVPFTKLHHETFLWHKLWQPSFVGLSSLRGLLQVIVGALDAAADVCVGHHQHAGLIARHQHHLPKVGEESVMVIEDGKFIGT